MLHLDVPVQEVITRDNVPVKVNAVVYFRVMEPSSSVVEVENYVLATRSALSDYVAVRGGVRGPGRGPFIEEKLNSELQAIIDERTDPWESRSALWR